MAHYKSFLLQDCSNSN